MAYRKKTKRTLSPEHLQKLQEGRAKAAAKREEQAKTKQRVALLSDLDKQLADGKRRAEMDNKFVGRRRKHRRTYS